MLTGNQRLLTFIFLCALSPFIFAASVLGLWKTIDDHTQQPKSIISLTQSKPGKLSGTVVTLFNKPNMLCQECKDEKKNKPVQGMEVLWGLAQHGDEWSGGSILDPKTGKTYRARLKLIDGGKKLQVRGYFGPFFRTQIWERQETATIPPTTTMAPATKK